MSGSKSDRELMSENNKKLGELMLKNNQRFEKNIEDLRQWELRRNKFIEVQIVNGNLHVEEVIINAMKINGYGNIGSFEITKSFSEYDYINKKRKSKKFKSVKQLFFERVKKRH